MDAARASSLRIVATTGGFAAGHALRAQLILAMTGMFEALGAAPGIGYPWRVVELVAAAIAGCALAIWHIGDWRPRLALTLPSTLGVFLPIPTAGEAGQLAIRIGLFQLLPLPCSRCWRARYRLHGAQRARIELPVQARNPRQAFRRRPVAGDAGEDLALPGVVRPLAPTPGHVVKNRSPSVDG